MTDTRSHDGAMIRELSASEFDRLGEIDRTERVRTGYRMAHGMLERMDVRWDSSNWLPTGPEHSVEHYVEFLTELHTLGSVTLGAFVGGRLVGVATWRPNLTETTDQLAFLHVSNGYRRQGIAHRLCDRLEGLARENGARSLYVSATPSESAVGFYKSCGFETTDTPHPELFGLEPEDIHMAKNLAG